MRALPSTQALRCFRAVATLGGIRVAASELSVTQSAISHQIKQLETHLGVALFQKQGRQIALTGAGQHYLSHIESVLKQLQQAGDHLSQQGDTGSLTVSAPPTFIANWLLPNLADFESENASISVRILESLTYDRSDSAIDVSIEYRFKPNAGFDCQPIMTDSLAILTAPGFAREHDIRSLDDLRRVRLIETERRLSSWSDVFWDELWIKTHSFLTVPYSYHAFEAARLGYGVAIGNTFNARRLLDDGQLVIPFELPRERWPEVPSYFVTTPEEKQQRASVIAFKAWLLRDTGTG